MSRRPFLENMRRELRHSLSDLDTTPLSKDVPKRDNGRGLSLSSSQEGALRGSGHKSAPEKENVDMGNSDTCTSAIKSKTHNDNNNNSNKKKKNNNSNSGNSNTAGSPSQGQKEKTYSENPLESDDENSPSRNYAVPRQQGLKSTSGPLVKFLDLPADTSTGKFAVSEVSPIFASSVASSETALREKKSWTRGEIDGREDTDRDLCTMRSEISFTTLQLELADEKRKNINAEQRLLQLEKEVRVLRAENVRLASMGAGEADHARKNAPDVFQNPDALHGRIIGGEGPSSLEQMVKELQDELQTVKHYAKELESRLAVKSSALEQRMCEVERKENRIRQLERTIADELIRRAGEEASHHDDDGPQKHHGDATTTKVVQGAPTPAVVRVPVELPRSLSRTRHPHPHPHPHPQEQPQEQHLQSHKKCQRTPKRPSSGARLLAQTKERIKEKERTVSTVTSRASLNSRSPTVTSTSLAAARARRKGRSDSLLNISTTTDAGAAASSTTVMSIRSSSAPRKKSLSVPTHSARPTSTHRRHISTSLTPHLTLFDDPLGDDVSSRWPVRRTAPLDTSAASLSLLSNHTGTAAGMAAAHSLDTRSVASTIRSRPRIHQDGDGVMTTTTVCGGTTTVVRRSVKRCVSPSLVPQPRSDFVEETQSEQPFVSELFSTTTYRPNRLVRCHKSVEGEDKK